ncbi:MAG: Holliday junction branch migration DNA helicase RuvB [Anaplasmataceae bacterium]|nr:Holliday junction branch migration DNA helicase RuvB [Anaplasmataceae bacterium]
MSNDELKERDQAFDQALRPQAWDDYIGQERVKENLKVMIEAAKKRKEAADHILFSGQAGLGKTTLAHLVAKELGGQLKVTSGPALEKVGDLAALLTNLEPDDVLFIDEAHRMNRLIEEVLYPAMENRKLHVMLGKGPAARSITLDLPPFTLIAATTRENLLSNPLRSRFGATMRLDYYNLEHLIAILERSAKLLNVKSDMTALEILAKAARGTPRIANRLLKRARDYMEVQNADLISENEARATLNMLQVDELGLEPQDRKLLEVIIEKFNGGPVGLNTLAAALSEDKGALEDIYEPYLMKIGFLQRTPAGRIVLPLAYDHLGAKRAGGML